MGQFQIIYSAKIWCVFIVVLLCLLGWSRFCKEEGVTTHRIVFFHSARNNVNSIVTSLVRASCRLPSGQWYLTTYHEANDRVDYSIS